MARPTDISHQAMVLCLPEAIAVDVLSDDKHVIGIGNHGGYLLGGIVLGCRSARSASGT
jgi:hypothetical protein